MAQADEHDEEQEGRRSPPSLTEVERSRDVAAQQQADGQPENAREIEKRRRGSASAERPD